jgi:predicted ATP-grasp superfamily ATP-dependent carboligase
MSTPNEAGKFTATAIVMNLYYTGLGIARSLGQRGIPVLGLTATRGVYGNLTRFAKVLLSPDSRSQAEELLRYLLQMGPTFAERPVIFPTRDDDVLFLDRYRAQLEPYYHLVAPQGAALQACLDKFETYHAAERASVPVPRSWLVEGMEDIRRIASELPYPCVLKPLSSHQWRQRENWELVGARKAIGVASESELIREYSTIAHAEKRAVVQEMIPGGDDCLLVAACYMDREGQYAGGFQIQKLVQVPAGFGTGCIVQSVSRPELVEPTVRMLRTIGLTGIAEVEYKWDAARGEYKLIEINARPWDQHRLGYRCGVDLMYLAYCDLAGLPAPPTVAATPGHKWIAEDAFCTTALQLAWHGDRQFFSLFRQARGKRVFAIWLANDPLPAVSYFFQYVGGLIAGCMRRIFGPAKVKASGQRTVQKEA